MTAEDVARWIHEAQPRQRVAWTDVPESKRQQLIATAAVVLQRIRSSEVDRLNTARAALRDAGGICEGQPRYGYRKENGKITPDDREQQAIAIMRRRRREGAKLREICTELEGRGIRPRRGKKWHPNTVRRVLEYGNRPFDRAG